MSSANSLSSIFLISSRKAFPLASNGGRQRHDHSSGDKVVIVAANTIFFPQFCSTSTSSLTIWRRSLLFNGKGYTVYDSTGSVVFRVDNYASDRPRETHLMDFSGNVLLTIRPSKQKLSILERWEAFKGNGDGLIGKAKPLFTATKGLVGNSRYKITVSGTQMDYLIACSSSQGCYKIYHPNSLNDPLAEVNRKCVNEPKVALGKDVLSLCVQPGIDQAIIMGLIIINHAMR